MFELYQMNEFIDAGLGKVSFITKFNKLDMFNILVVSDNALFNLFKKLKSRYPQTS